MINKSTLLILLTITILSITTNSFTIQTQTQPIIQFNTPSNNHNFKLQLGSCIINQTNIVPVAIQQCQKNSSLINQTTNCILKYIQNNFDSQQWNVFIKNSSTNNDVFISFWYYSGCYIKLDDYGKYNRSFIIWPSEDYVTKSTQFKSTNQLSNKNKKISKLHQLSQLINNNNNQDYYRNQQFVTSIKSVQSQSYITRLSNPAFIKSQQQNRLSSIVKVNQVEGTCPQWIINSITGAVQQCDIPGNDHAAQCIMSRVKDELTQNWDVIVSSAALTNNFYASYWVYNECSFSLSKQGTYNRYVYLWDAY